MKNNDKNKKKLSLVKIDHTILLTEKLSSRVLSMMHEI